MSDGTVSAVEKTDEEKRVEKINKQIEEFNKLKSAEAQLRYVRNTPGFAQHVPAKTWKSLVEYEKAKQEAEALKGKSVEEQLKWVREKGYKYVDPSTWKSLVEAGKKPKFKEAKQVLTVIPTFGPPSKRYYEPFVGTIEGVEPSVKREVVKTGDITVERITPREPIKPIPVETVFKPVQLRFRLGEEEKRELVSKGVLGLGKAVGEAKAKVFAEDVHKTRIAPSFESPELTRARETLRVGGAETTKRFAGLGASLAGGVVFGGVAKAVPVVSKIAPVLGGLAVVQETKRVAGVAEKEGLAGAVFEVPFIASEWYMFGAGARIGEPIGKVAKKAFDIRIGTITGKYVPPEKMPIKLGPGYPSVKTFPREEAVKIIGKTVPTVHVTTAEKFPKLIEKGIEITVPKPEYVGKFRRTYELFGFYTEPLTGSLGYAGVAGAEAPTRYKFTFRRPTPKVLVFEQKVEAPIKMKELLSVSPRGKEVFYPELLKAARAERVRVGVTTPGLENIAGLVAEKQLTTFRGVIKPAGKPRFTYAGVERVEVVPAIISPEATLLSKDVPSLLKRRVFVPEVRREPARYVTVSDFFRPALVSIAPILVRRDEKVSLVERPVSRDLFRLVPPVVREPPTIREPPIIREPPSRIVSYITRDVERRVELPFRLKPPVIRQPPIRRLPPVVRIPSTRITPPVVREPPTIREPPVRIPPPTRVIPPVVREPPTIREPPIIREPPTRITPPLKRPKAPTTILMPSSIPILNFLEVKKKRRKVKGERVKPVRKKKYRPSLTAGLVGIFGKKPERVTGLEIRPLLKGRKKKKLKKKKKTVKKAIKKSKRNK